MADEHSFGSVRSAERGMLSKSSLHSKFERTVLSCAVYLAACHASLCWAQDLQPAGPSDSISSGEVAIDSMEMESRLDALNDRLRKLEETSKEPGKAKNKLASPSNEVPSDKWSVKLGGHIQTDFVTWANADPSIPNTQNYANFRRLRLLADGVGYDSYDFRLQLTLEPEGETTALTATGLVKDAYFSLNDIPGLGRFRIGHFFVPFSLEQVTNDTNNIFLERSIPTQTVFAADREIGVALYNHSEDKRLHWATGAFIDSHPEGTKKRFDDNQGLRLSGRLTYLPYFDEASEGRYLVHTGIGILHTEDSDHTVRFRTRPQISEGPRLIDSGALFADSFTTGNLEGAIVWERFTIQSEAFLSGVNLNNGPQTTATGAYVHLSWFLTGESRMYERYGQHGSQFGRNRPFRNFSVKRGVMQPGAWELKTRWSHLDLDNFQRGTYNDFTLGVNWYWSDRVRMMFDWIRPYTSESTVVGKTDSDILGLRWDVNW